MSKADITVALETLLSKISNDYVDYMSNLRSTGNQEIRNKMVAEFTQTLDYTIGNKYIRITRGGSAWGFVVNTTEDKKFKYGDILKPAGYKTPARNAARGNVFEKYDIRWTGPSYLR